MIGIIDIGLGNLSSIKNAVETLFFDAQIIKSSRLIKDCTHLILPGVGSFKFGMNQINTFGWKSPIIDFVKSGKPVLGICLGMQLLFSYGDEFGHEKGLNLIPGNVKKLVQKEKYKLPHVGWNSFVNMTQHQILENINPEIDVYFVHSYHCIPDKNKYVLALTQFSETFVSIVGKENVFGTQFHPEKSYPTGIRFLKNFLNWNKIC